MKTGLTLVSLILSVAVIALKIHVAWTGWGYFVTPTSGIPTPNYAVIYGLMCLWGVFTARTPSEAEEYAKAKRKASTTAEERMVDDIVNTLVVGLGLLVSWGIMAYLHGVAS